MKGTARLSATNDGLAAGKIGLRTVGGRMAAFGLPLPELECYRPSREESHDFDRFRQTTLEDTRSFPRPPPSHPV